MRKDGRILLVLLVVLLAVAGYAGRPAIGHTDPVVETASAAPNPVGQGQDTTVEATVSCFLTGCALSYAEAYILPEMNSLFPGATGHDDPAKNGIPLTPLDGLWGNADTEIVRAVNDTAFLAVGDHDVYVRVQGRSGSDTSWWSKWYSFTLTVDTPTTDTSPPAHVNLHFEPDANILAGENSVDLVITLDDTGDPGTANVGGAEYWYGGCGGGITPPTGTLSARDGAADEQVEEMAVTLDVSGLPDGTHFYDVWGWDALNNYPVGCAEVELYVQRAVADTQGPTTIGAAVVPGSVVQGGGPVDVTAQVDDAARGGSNVGASEFFVDPDPLTGNPNPPPYVNDMGTLMISADGFYNEVTEDIAKYSLDVSAWLPGIYTLYVHGRDQWGNWGGWVNPQDYSTTTLVVGNPIPLAPTGLAISVSGANLRLDWTPPSPSNGLDHYNVYRSGSASTCPGTLLGIASGVASSFTDTSGGVATDANPYFYVVRSANPSNQEEANCAQVGKVAVSLVPGVNEISTPFLPTDPSPAGVFSPVWTPFVGVMAYNATTQAWSGYNKSGGGPLAQVDNAMGLRVYMNTAAMLPLVGRVPAATVVPVAVGWNFLGYGSLLVGSTPGVFSTFTGTWTVATLYVPTDRYNPWRHYDAADASFRDLTGLAAGQGFWFYATAAGDWTLTVA